MGEKRLRIVLECTTSRTSNKTLMSLFQNKYLTNTKSSPSKFNILKISLT